MRCRWRVNLHPHVVHDPLAGHLQRPRLRVLAARRRRARMTKIGERQSGRRRPDRGPRCTDRSRASSGTAAPAAARMPEMIAASASATCRLVRPQVAQQPPHRAWRRTPCRGLLLRGRTMTVTSFQSPVPSEFPVTRRVANLPVNWELLELLDSARRQLLLQQLPLYSDA